MICKYIKEAPPTFHTSSSGIKCARQIGGWLGDKLDSLFMGGGGLWCGRRANTLSHICPEALVVVVEVLGKSLLVETSSPGHSLSLSLSSLSSLSLSRAHVLLFSLSLYGGVGIHMCRYICLSVCVQ